jgi:hypothetical protein
VSFWIALAETREDLGRCGFSHLGIGQLHSTHWPLITKLGGIAGEMNQYDHAAEVGTKAVRNYRYYMMTTSFPQDLLVTLRFSPCMGIVWCQVASDAASIGGFVRFVNY